jgi:hypothetical protein
MKNVWIYLGMLFLNLLSHAQIVSFDGLGRAVVSNDKLQGNAVQDDTLTPDKNISGYTLLDLGVNVKPSEYFRVRAEFRARNNFGQFFGAGTSVNLRQFIIEGKVKKRVYYSIGDIDVKLSPYTVFNSYENFNSFESDLFAQRRAIVEYENFNKDNAWRLQGAKGGTVVPIDSISDLSLFVFLTRTRESDNVGIPDRFLSGGKLELNWRNWLSLGTNYVSFDDNAPQTDVVNYSNKVFTGFGKGGYAIGTTTIGAKMEGGSSWYSNENRSIDSTVSYQDFFFDTRAYIQLLNKRLNVEAGYLNVGPQFSSPSAQTLRIHPAAQPLLFQDLQNNSVKRGQTIFDRATQENFYNQAISPQLFLVLPQYNNVLPYGLATPNRKGLMLTTQYADTSGIVKASAEYYALSDIIGEGNDQLRTYSMLRGGIHVNAGKLVKWKKMIAVHGGIKMENTSRDGLAPVAFKSTMTDVGLSIEVLKELDVLLGVKSLNASGNEYTIVRDEYNNPASFLNVDLNLKQQVLSTGARFRFSPKSWFTVQYSELKNSNVDDATNDYNIRQVFLYYTVQF